MDTRFLPAAAAIREGDVPALRAILEAQPELASSRSTCSHPTLMQCLALDAVGLPVADRIAMATLLLERGSPVDEPLIAAASMGNVVVGAFLLDHGAKIDGDPNMVGGWTPLEESLYWGFPAMTELLLARGARIPNLRAAAGLGRCDEMVRFFDEAGALRPDAGGINSPFGDLEVGAAADLAQNILDNALSYAAMGGHDDAVDLLIERGAAVDAIPHGFDFRGTALHWAAIRGHRSTCDRLLAHGADPTILDLKVRSTPAGWARHDGHTELGAYLDEIAKRT